MTKDVLPLLALMTVCVVPVLVVMEPTRRWLFVPPRSVYLWSAPAGITLIGMMSFKGVASVLIAAPLLQGLTYVLLDGAFRLVTGRPPVSYAESRKSGKSYWADRAFWLLGFVGLIMVGVVLCGSFGVPLPSRYRGGH